MKEVISSSSVKARRTIKEVSHLFLSSVPVPSEMEKPKPIPLVGCYLAKGSKEETRSFETTLRILQSGGLAAHVCYLDSSSFSLESSEFEATALSTELLLELSAEEIPTSDMPDSDFDFCLFVLREDDCSFLDPLFRFFNYFLIVSPMTGRGMTETFKFMKAVKLQNERSKYFLHFSTSESANVSSRAGEEFNKLTDRWIHAPIQILHSGIPASLRQWQQTIKEAPSEDSPEQAYILKRIFTHA